jgi:hypothetical protein
VKTRRGELGYRMYFGYEVGHTTIDAVIKEASKISERVALAKLLPDRR